MEQGAARGRESATFRTRTPIPSKREEGTPNERANTVHRELAASGPVHASQPGGEPGRVGRVPPLPPLPQVTGCLGLRMAARCPRGDVPLGPVPPGGSSWWRLVSREPRWPVHRSWGLRGPPQKPGSSQAPPSPARTCASPPGPQPLRPGLRAARAAGFGAACSGSAPLRG